MVKAELGTKRTCPSCAARFYDLLKNPIVCPKCNANFIAPTVLPLTSVGDPGTRVTGVAAAQVVSLGCTAQGQTEIRLAIEAHKLNRVVIAGCTPRLYGDDFDGEFFD